MHDDGTNRTEERALTVHVVSMQGLFYTFDHVRSHQLCVCVCMCVCVYVCVCVCV